MDAHSNVTSIPSPCFVNTPCESLANAYPVGKPWLHSSASQPLYVGCAPAPLHTDADATPWNFSAHETPDPSNVDTNRLFSVPVYPVTDASEHFAIHVPVLLATTSPLRQA